MANYWTHTVKSILPAASVNQCQCTKQENGYNFMRIDEQEFIQIERDISDGNFNVDDWVVIENVN